MSKFFFSSVSSLDGARMVCECQVSLDVTMMTAQCTYSEGSSTKKYCARVACASTVSLMSLLSDRTCFAASPYHTILHLTLVRLARRYASLAGLTRPSRIADTRVTYEPPIYGGFPPRELRNSAKRLHVWVIGEAHTVHVRSNA